MTFRSKLAKDVKKNKYNYIMILPVILFYVLFDYKPMYGCIIAFKDYDPILGIWESEWVGFEHFKRFLIDPYTGRIVRNTLRIKFLSILVNFPAPILFALMLNEIRVSWFKRTVQTITYLPHFVATIIMCNIFMMMCRMDGPFALIVEFFGGKNQNLLLQKSMFDPIYQIFGLWKGIGWGTITYLAAFASIDPEQYEAARIDGAGRIQQMFYITLPTLVPLICFSLILTIGNALSVGFETIMLLYNELTYEVSDVISTYNYRKGLVGGNYSYSAAVGMFNNVIEIILLVIANTISKKVTKSGVF